jgi:imidazolonepropionase
MQANLHPSLGLTALTDQLFTHARIAAMSDGPIPYGLIEDGAVAVKDGRIAWVGRQSDTPSDCAGLATTSLKGKLVTPALIDCHTHVVFGGNRAAEFEMRLNGASYEEIALAGGGIVSTVKATRGRLKTNS